MIVFVVLLKELEWFVAVSKKTIRIMKMGVVVEAHTEVRNRCLRDVELFHMREIKWLFIFVVVRVRQLA